MVVLSLALVLSTLPGFEAVDHPDAGPSEAAPAVVESPSQGPQFTPPAPAPVPAPAAALPAAPDAGAPPLTAQGVLDVVTAWIRPYAIIKPTIIVSSGAVESYSQPNATAITAAGNPVLANLPNEARLTFQVAQSRAGLWLNEKGSVRGRLEIDFIDFTKATPTVASLPRLRLAYLEWQPSEAFTLLAGQDWDLHAPVQPHGANMVGARFLSGNAGFMRQQVKAIGKVGVFELAAAVGMEGVNAAAKDSAFELSLVPTFAVRGSWLVGKGGRIGVSGLGTALRLAPGSATERRTFAGGGSAFADFTLGTTNVRGEVNVGQNMANLGLLTLGFGVGANDVTEWGGFFSVRHGITPMHFVYVNAGLMRVINRDAVTSSYSYASMPADGSPPAMKDAALAGTGPGMVHNGGATLGYELKLTKNLSFILEGFFLYSEHKLLAVDQARVSGTRMAGGSELSVFVSF